MRAAALQMPKVQYSITRLGALQSNSGITPGGLDQTTPSLSLQPGALRDALNFECVQTGGYARIQGYERFDGRPAPSDASYSIVQVDVFQVKPQVGDLIEQYAFGPLITTVDDNQPILTPDGQQIKLSTEGSTTGIVMAVNDDDPDAQYIVATKVTEQFVYGRIVISGGNAVGFAIPTTVVMTGLENAQFVAQAADVYRADIDAVPGSGPIIDVVGMTVSGLPKVFAFRANGDATKVLIYEASSSGWVNVPLLSTVEFTAGTGSPSGANNSPLDGETLTQGGVTATIKRVMWRSGGWAGTAVGGFVIADPVGGNFAAGAATTSGGAAITLSGAETAIVILPGGKGQHEKCNFFGQASYKRAYGCDGVNKAYEFDGTTYAPITTGLTTDAPTDVKYHGGYLFASYASSVVYCGPGTPFRWSTTDGGGEIAVGDEVQDFISYPGTSTTSALVIYCRDKTSVLYGLGASSFSLVTFNSGIGGAKGSAQNFLDGFVFNRMGVITMRTTLNYGNFDAGVLTQNIAPFVKQEHAKVSTSCISQTKSQYRTFFNDGYGLYLTMVNKQYMGSIPVYFPNPVNCIDVSEDANGGEATYFGSTDSLGYVYQLDSGTSFDGADLPAYITLAWDHIKTPRLLKRFRAASVEIQSTTYTQISFGYQLGYGSQYIGQPVPTQYAANFTEAPHWDAFIWDAFVWDGQSLAPTEIGMTGTAENVQVTISSGGNYIGAYTVNSVVYHYSLRRGLRP